MIKGFQPFLFILLHLIFILICLINNGNNNSIQTNRTYRKKGQIAIHNQSFKCATHSSYFSHFFNNLILKQMKREAYVCHSFVAP